MLWVHLRCGFVQSRSLATYMSAISNILRWKCLIAHFLSEDPNAHFVVPVLRHNISTWCNLSVRPEHVYWVILHHWQLVMQITYAYDSNWRCAPLHISPKHVGKIVQMVLVHYISQHCFVFNMIFNKLYHISTNHIFCDLNTVKPVLRHLSGDKNVAS